MFIEHAAQTHAGPVRGDMFIDHATPNTVEPRRGGMIERISRHGDRANTTNPLDVKTDSMPPLTGLIWQCGRGSKDMPHLRCWARVGMPASTNAVVDVQFSGVPPLS